jgi:hypothetical protein
VKFGERRAERDKTQRALNETTIDGDVALARFFGFNELVTSDVA